jgi:hypothetical protein
MSDISQPASVTPPSAPPVPLPNDPAARSPTGEILEPSQIPTETPTTTPDPSTTTTTSEPTSTPKDPAAKPAEPAKAPEAYADFTPPEGYTLNKEAIDAVTPIFKELGLSQDQAQKLVAIHAEQMIAAAKGPESTYATMRTDWQAKVKADPDLAAAVNGDKTGLDAVKLDIGRALNALGDAALATEFKAAMDLTGAGDHPAFVKTMWKLASFITEGKHVAGTNPSPHGQTQPGAKPPSAAKALYPNLA